MYGSLGSHSNSPSESQLYIAVCTVHCRGTGRLESARGLQAVQNVYLVFGAVHLGAVMALAVRGHACCAAQTKQNNQRQKWPVLWFSVLSVLHLP